MHQNAQAPVHETLPAWFAPFVEAGQAGTDKPLRYEMMVTIQRLAMEGALVEVDAALALAPVPTLADTTLMTLLRGTFRFRGRLPAWSGFRDKVAVEFGARGLPVDGLMYGLLDGREGSR